MAEHLIFLAFFLIPVFCSIATHAPTMSKLATFRVEDEQWEVFQQEAKKRGVSASSLLQDFVAWINQGNELPKMADASHLLESDIDKRIEAKIAPILEELAQLRVSLGELAA